MVSVVLFYRDHSVSLGFHGDEINRIETVVNQSFEICGEFKEFTFDCSASVD